MSRFCAPTIDYGEEWTHSKFSCFNNCGLCVYTWFCPCVVFGKVAEDVDEPCCCCGCLWMTGCAGAYAHFRVRGKVRAKYDIKGSWLKDCCVAYFCGLCTLIQETREIREHVTDEPEKDDEDDDKDDVSDVKDHSYKNNPPEDQPPQTQKVGDLETTDL